MVWKAKYLLADQGMNSKVYMLESGDIAKFINTINYYNRDVELRNIEKELHWQTLLSYDGIAPKIKDFFYCDNVKDRINAVIIMENVGTVTLRQFVIDMDKYLISFSGFIDNCSKIYEIFANCVSKILTLISMYKVVHGDFNQGNIMLNYNENENFYDIILIDFGNVEVIKNNENICKDFEVFETSFIIFNKKPNVMKNILINIINDSNYKFKFSDLQKYWSTPIKDTLTQLCNIIKNGHNYDKVHNMLGILMNNHVQLIIKEIKKDMDIFKLVYENAQIFADYE